MSSDLPAQFVDLNTALIKRNQVVNVMGVITDIMPPKKSGGSDWMSSFSIIDSNYIGTYDQGLKVRFFRPMEPELPTIRRTGDILLLRFLKISEWQGMTIGISTKGTSWTLFPAASIPSKPSATPLKLEYIKEPRAPIPAPAEMQYAVSLCNSRDRNSFTEPTSTNATPVPITSSNLSMTQNQSWRDKFSLIKDIKSDTFYDLIGQAVKIYPTGDRVELYLTDYTSNTLLFNYEWGQEAEDEDKRNGDDFNYTSTTSASGAWPGPFGKMTLTVTLWPPHSDFGRQNLKENDYVFLRNVRIKFSKDSKLEGVMHSDRRYPDRIDLTILKDNENDDRVKDVLRRKRDYGKKFQKSSADFLAEARGLKRKEMQDSKPLSRAQKRKRNKERDRLAKEKSDAIKVANGRENDQEVLDRHDSISDATLAMSRKQGLNKNASILSLDKHENTTPEGVIYTLPFQNINSRTTVRVIDFSPSNLANFAVPCPKSTEFDILSDAGSSQGESDSGTSSSDIDSGQGDRRWEWRFLLKLEDAMGPKNDEKASMDVYVAGQDAECLLKLDAEDLHKSPKALATLREKLFLLWGDLEEQKSRKLAAALSKSDDTAQIMRIEEEPQTKPFQCCLKEYGVKVRAENTIGADDVEGTDTRDLEKNWVWERRWRLFGTTII
ncbi:hypothetical protein ACLMJK_000648 [Lecanora helva]